MNVAKMIDHTILKPNVTDADVIKVCSEAKEYGFFSVCVNPYFVPLVAKELSGTDVKVTSVIGFPLGASTTFIKAAEAKKAVEDGANEIDMVINVSALKDGKYDFVQSDIAAVVDAIKGKAILKVILETCLLTKEEIVKGCELSKAAGAQFVKTSTGVRDYETAMAVIQAGATRIGASSSVDIATHSKTSNSDY